MLLEIELEIIKQCLAKPELLKNLFIQKLGYEPIRWGGIGISNNKVLIEAIGFPELRFQAFELIKHKNIKSFSTKEIGIAIIPTGLGCSIGGFGGDANIFANLMAEEFDNLIINPNIVNGGAWQNIPSKALYTEGLAIDLFTKGLIALRPKKRPDNKIGIVIDSSLSDSALKRELQVIEAAKLIWGLNILEIQMTESKLDLNIDILPKGFSSGNIQNPKVLLKAAQQLIDKGAEAIAIITNMSDLDAQNETNGDLYMNGNSPDPIGGLEAILSHLITATFLIPAAHAPSFDNLELAPEAEKLDKRVSPEIASYSFLPSVLKGLAQAPSLIPINLIEAGDLNLNNLKAFIAPADCWLGESFINLASHQNISKYAVQNNICGINLNPELMNFENINKVNNYFELIGYLKAWNLGFSF